jgi:hypothetical protein
MFRSKLELFNRGVSVFIMLIDLSYSHYIIGSFVLMLACLFMVKKTTPKDVVGDQVAPEHGAVPKLFSMLGGCSAIALVGSVFFSVCSGFYHAIFS